tara:strand:+ start:81 stop:266 length:186 start_codon:yes stop_codon:yes gene_type:complete
MKKITLLLLLLFIAACADMPNVPKNAKDLDIRKTCKEEKKGVEIISKSKTLTDIFCKKPKK